MEPSRGATLSCNNTGLIKNLESAVMRLSKIELQRHHKHQHDYSPPMRPQQDVCVT